MGSTWSWIKDTTTVIIGSLIVGGLSLVAAGVIVILSWTFACIMGAALLLFLIVALLDYFFFGEDKESDLPDFSNTALVGEFPYHASIHLDKQHICSGALIGTYFILTVAQCVYTFVNNQKETSKLKLYVGERVVPCYSIFSYDVEKITVHPKFAAHRLAYNMAVLKTTAKINERDYIFPVSLPSPRMNIEKTTVNISGFRNLDVAGMPVDMTKSSMIIIPYDTCYRHFNKRIATSNKFCVIPSHRWKPCQTSRGGLATNTDDVLIGVYVMPNPQGCAKDLPEIFVDVKKFLDFIRKYATN